MRTNPDPLRQRIEVGHVHRRREREQCLAVIRRAVLRHVESLLPQIIQEPRIVVPVQVPQHIRAAVAVEDDVVDVRPFTATGSTIVGSDRKERLVAVERC